MSESVKDVAEVRERATAKGSSWRTVGLVVAVLALYMLWTRPAALPAGWGEDFEAASNEAKAANRPLLIEFHSEGCAPCLLMERQVLPDARVQSAVRAFVPVRVDAFRRVDLMQRFGVAGTPAFVIADASGQLVSQVLGSRTVEDFLEFLERGASATKAAAVP